MAKLTYQRHPLSASTNYLPIPVAATSDVSPTLIHTASASDVDEIWLDVYNYALESVQLTMMLGGSEAHKKLALLVPSGRGLISVIKGLNFTGSVLLEAYASDSTSLSLVGYVNRLVLV